MSKVISIQEDHNPKVKCDICGKELWLLDTKAIRDLEDEAHLVCGSCYQDVKDESIIDIND
jgi:hypothetical protein